MNNNTSQQPNTLTGTSSNFIRDGSDKKPDHALPSWKRYGPEVTIGLAVNILAAILYDQGPAFIKASPQLWMPAGIAALIAVQFLLFRSAFRKATLLTQLEYERKFAAVRMAAEEESRKWRVDFQDQSEVIHQFIHHARDLGIKLLPRNRIPGKLPPEATVKAHLADLSDLLNLLVGIFTPYAPAGTKVWAALRELQDDNKFHTILRTYHCHPSRAEHSPPLSQQSNIVQTLKDSYRDKNKRDCVILSGSDSPGWQKMPNDALDEDKCVLMGAVFSKIYDGQQMRNPLLTWILCVNADRAGAFTEDHKDLMKACNDVFSWLVNEFVRYHAPSLSDPKKGDTEIQKKTEPARVGESA